MDVRSVFLLSLIPGDTNFYDTLPFTRGRRCSDLINYGILYHIIYLGHQWATVQALAEFAFCGCTFLGMFMLPILSVKEMLF